MQTALLGVTALALVAAVNLSSARAALHQKIDQSRHILLASSLTLFRQILAIFLLSLLVNTEHGLAIKGYDPVTYFTTGKPTPGLAQFSTN